MGINELKKLVIGKTLRAVRNVDFDTCYPVVRSTQYGKKSIVIDVVCSEFGSFDRGTLQYWATDGVVAVFTNDKEFAQTGF